MSITAITMAGRKPAMKSAAMEEPVIEAMTIIWMHGGTKMPMAEAAETMETESGLL